MMIRKLWYCLLLFSLVNNQLDAQEDFDRLNKLMHTFNEGMVYWGGQNRADYPRAMERLINYESDISKIYRIDPRIDARYFKYIDDNFANANTRFIRFMFNCSRNRPEVAKKNNSYKRAWNMAQRQKSFFSRFYIVKGMYDNLSHDLKQRADSLLTVKFETRNGSDSSLINEQISDIIPNYSVYSQDVPNIRALQNSLSDNDVYLSFIYSDNARSVFVWKIKKNSEKVFKLRINSSDLFVRVEMIKALMEKDQIFFDYLKEVLLYEEESYGKDKRALTFLTDDFSMSGLIKTISNKVIKPLTIKKYENIIIEVDQNLASLPFEILKNNGIELNQFNTISYTYSANSFLSNNSSIENSNYEYLGFGNDNNGELKVANDEIRNAASLFENSKISINPTESELYEIINASNSDIVHFSTHSSLGILETKIRYKSQSGKFFNGVIQEREIALLYKKDQYNDGRVVSEEIFRKVNATNKNPLLILSSCEVAPSLNTKAFLGLKIQIKTTDLVEEGEDSEEMTPVRGGCICTFSEPISALISSFSAKGYKHILATQWKVDAYFADNFIHTFLKFYKSESNPEKALQLAQQYYSKDEPKENWGAFIYLKL